MHWLLHPLSSNLRDPYEHTTAYTHDSFGRLLTVSFGDDARAWNRRAALGGLCPHCDEPVAINDLTEGR